MGAADYRAALEQKKDLVNRLLVKTLELNGAIKSDNYEKIYSVDEEKKGLLKSLESADAELKKTAAGSQEDVKDIIKNINSLLVDLIKLEKENELLITLRIDSASGRHAEAYKTYKYIK